jgi:hypothetical protein
MTLRTGNQVLLTVFIFIAVLLNIAGCARGRSRDTAQSSATPAPTPAHITANDLKKLRWIEGTWRGTGYETPFYERYHFENDNTLIVEGLADESVNKVTDTTRFELKDGQFGNDSEGRSVATELTDNYITFSPLARGQNTFRFQKESPDLWKAVLTWPASEKRPAGERVYHMERWPPVKR